MGRVAAIVPAAGRGRRVGAAVNKLLLPLAGRPVLAHTLAAFQAAPSVDEVILVAGREDLDACRRLLANESFDKVSAVVPGGAERQDSVARGLEALGDDVEIVLVHDGARPLVPVDLIEASVREARRRGAVVAALPVKDTVKLVAPEGAVRETPDRRACFAAQTPQAFRADVLRRAIAWARAAGFAGTDEASLVEKSGGRVQVIPGREENIKITTPDDFILAEVLLARRAGAANGGRGAFGGGAGVPAESGTWRGVTTVRVGFGYDVHALVEGRRLVLGGVDIPFDKGLAGHSDADVLTHALMDALLGAAGLGDIGRRFPDTDERYRGADSIGLLERVVELLEREGWRPGNADLTLVAQRPRLAGHVPAMRERLAAALRVPPARVNIKATTTEGLGFAGRGEGIAAYAVAVLRQCC